MWMFRIKVSISKKLLSNNDSLFHSSLQDLHYQNLSGNISHISQIETKFVDVKINILHYFQEYRYCWKDSTRLPINI